MNYKKKKKKKSMIIKINKNIYKIYLKYMSIIINIS